MIGYSRLLLTLLAGCLGVGCRVVIGEDGHHPKPSESKVAAIVKSSDPWVEGVLPEEPLSAVPRDGGEVVIEMNVDPPSLNSLTDSDWWGSQIADHRIYESLVSIDPHDSPNYPVVPGLAERWEVSADHLTYTFHLRHGVSWHDGAPLTARDVIATFNKVQDPTTKAMHIRSYTKEIERYEALDDYTVRFHLSHPYFLVMDGVFADVSILPAHIIDSMTGQQFNEAATNPLNRHPVGTGPYCFSVWETSQRIVLEKNRNYWGVVPHLDRLIFRIIPEATIALELARRGEIDVVSRLRAEQWVHMTDPAFRRHFWRSKFYGANYSWIGWNQERSLFADKRVRRALTLLTDRPGIINALQYGLAKPTSCHFYWASPACEGVADPLPYDPLAAVRLLEEAGYIDHDGDGIRDKDGHPFRFTFMLPAGSEESARMATKMKEDFDRAGLELNLQRVEWSAFVKRLRDHDFDACTLSWASGSPRSDPSQIWHSSSIAGGSNFIGFKNQAADVLMDQARSLLVDATRDELYRAFGRILNEEQPYTFLFVRPTLALISRRVHGAKASLMGWRYEEWWVDEKPRMNWQR